MVAKTLTILQQKEKSKKKTFEEIFSILKKVFRILSSQYLHIYKFFSFNFILLKVTPLLVSFLNHTNSFIKCNMYINISKRAK